jgi:hypothetical protein
MRILRLVTLLFLAGSTLCSFAQNSQSQPPPDAQPPLTQGSSEQRTPAPPETPPASGTQKAAPSKPLRVIIVVPPKKPAHRQPPEGPVDPEIYLLKEARFSSVPESIAITLLERDFE